MMRPVTTSTEGRWVAITRWIPVARASCASRQRIGSTSSPAVIIRSASSSTIAALHLHLLFLEAVLGVGVGVTAGAASGSAGVAAAGSATDGAAGGSSMPGRTAWGALRTARGRRGREHLGRRRGAINLYGVAHYSGRPARTRPPAGGERPLVAGEDFQQLLG